MHSLFFPGDLFHSLTISLWSADSSSIVSFSRPGFPKANIRAAGTAQKRAFSLPSGVCGYLLQQSGEAEYMEQRLFLLRNWQGQDLKLRM